MTKDQKKLLGIMGHVHDQVEIAGDTADKIGLSDVAKEIDDLYFHVGEIRTKIKNKFKLEEVNVGE